MDIVIKKGLDIPLTQQATSQIESRKVTKTALTFDTFLTSKGIKLLVKPGDHVSQGSPIAQDKDGSGRFFVSPASGQIEDIRRGARRSLKAIVIALDETPALSLPSLSPKQIERDALIQAMIERGLFAHIRQRPFNRLADPQKKPRSIFVKALESAPLGFHPEAQVEQHKESFQAGLDFLKVLTDGSVHLVHETKTTPAIASAQNVLHHTASGPHPRSLTSVHIHHVDPIRSSDDVIWTLSAWDVIVIGATLTSGVYFNEKLVALGGDGFVDSKRCHLKTITGAYIGDLVHERLTHSKHGEKRLISGSPLMGTQVTLDDFLHFEHSSLVALTESQNREFLHFFRPGLNKFTASGAYLGAFMPSQEFKFTTSQHGEERAFIDGEVYERVMPMRIPTIHLVKACMADDIDSAIELGLLEIDAEDFALPTFVCPSKVEMVEVMKEALERYSEQLRR